MRRDRINYFESPNPVHFNEAMLHQTRYHHPDDHEVQEQRLFSTPRRLNTHLITNLSPIMDSHLISSHPRATQSQDFFCPQNQNQQQYQQNHLGIQQKVEFSEEEDLLIHITPQKVQRVEDESQPVPTIKRANPQNMTPISQGRTNERGLKRLASEAYRFVTQQKKTTYKEVARRLIGQMGDDNEIDINRKGQLNIKRRVYDALNVLIALGLLKRNGNKILSKKVEHSGVFSHQSAQREQQQIKQEQMEKELISLRAQYDRRIIIMDAKRKHLKEAKQKIDHLKALQNKNLSQHQEPNQTKIDFPLVAVCLKEKDQNLLEKQHQSNFKEKESMMKIWMQGLTNLYCSFNPISNLQLLGELDLVRRWQKAEAREIGKIEKIRRRKR